MNPDQITPVAVGDALSAERDGKILEVLARRIEGYGVSSDDATVQIGPPIRADEVLVFELKSTLTLGGSQQAYRLRWSSVNSRLERDTSREFKVYDLDYQWEANVLPTTQSGQQEQNGLRGWAILVDRRWKIVWLERQAAWIECDVAEDFEPDLGTGDDTFAVENVSYYNGFTPRDSVTSVVNGVERSGTDGTRICALLDRSTGTYRLVWSDRENQTSPIQGGVTTEECDDILVTPYNTLGETTTTSTATAAEVLDAMPNPGEITPVPDPLPSPAWCVTTGEPFPYDPQARIVNPGFTWAAGDTLRLRISADGAYWIEGVISGDFAAICTACADGIAAPFGYEVAFSGFVGAASLNDTFTLEHVEDVTYCRWQADVDPNTHAGVAHIVHLIWWNWVAKKYERTIILYSDELDEFDAYIPLVEWYEYFETDRPNCLPIVAEVNYAFPLEEYAEPVNDEAAAFNAAVDATGVTCTVTAITVAP